MTVPHCWIISLHLQTSQIRMFSTTCNSFPAILTTVSHLCMFRPHNPLYFVLETVKGLHHSRPTLDSQGRLWRSIASTGPYGLTLERHHWPPSEPLSPCQPLGVGRSAAATELAFIQNSQYSIQLNIITHNRVPSTKQGAPKYFRHLHHFLH